jgi:hypothetical protein
VVAVFLLFVVGAMAALAIDVVTFYTARSEAQLAADGAALAGARVLANSGLTSAADPFDAEALATTIATQVAAQNHVGGRGLNPASEVFVTFNDGATTFATNPQVTVRVQRTDLPTFFARIWGSKQVTVAASATAEAYNPSGAYALSGATIPVAPICVKPWLLPNIDPTSPNGAPTNIFDPDTGAISNLGLLGWASPNGAGSIRLHARCTAPCGAGNLTPVKWQYYQGDETSFPHPTQALPACAPPLVTDFQESIAGCVQTPIVCGSPVNSQVNINTVDNANRDTEAAAAVDCLTHTSTNNGDTIAAALAPPVPFEFIAGADNPIPGLDGNDVMVSDSLVTVPVFDSRPWSSGTDVTSPVIIIGFVQLFLNPTGAAVGTTGPNAYHIRTKIINIAGCGTLASGQPILGNGASPVPVRLISPP